MDWSSTAQAKAPSLSVPPKGKEDSVVLPKEGDVIESCHEQQVRLPVLVVSVNALQRSPCHGRREGSRNDLEVPVQAGLPVKGLILPHHCARSIAKPQVRKLCTVPERIEDSPRSSRTGATVCSPAYAANTSWRVAKVTLRVLLPTRPK